MTSEPKALLGEGLGDCYEVSCQFITERAQLTGTTEDGQEIDLTDLVVLVHGAINPPGIDIGRHTHAWLEVEGNCLDLSRGQTLMMPQETYYGVSGVDVESCLRYTREEARVKLLAFNHYGPWEGEGACPPQHTEVLIRAKTQLCIKDDLNEEDIYNLSLINAALEELMTKHMQPEIQNGEWWEVETKPDGTVWFPANLFGVEEIIDNHHPDNVLSVEKTKGWGARLSAPGYLDCTDWCVFETEEEAEAYLEELEAE